MSLQKPNYSLIIKNFGVKKAAKHAKEILISQGYVYNDVYGWEKPELIESFGLDPNMTGVPCSLQPKWIEVEVKFFKDNHGNTQKVAPGTTRWERSTTERAWYPTENWLAYIAYRKQKNLQQMAFNSIPLPAE